jgi:ZIP family zinc transporter
VAVSEAVLVFLLALLTALATGLGALPFLFARKPTRRWLGLSNAAAGLMLAASLGLAYEGALHGPVGVLVGAGLGFAFIILVRRLVSVEEHPAVFAGLSGLDAQGTPHRRHHDRPLLHGGVGLGVSFGSGTDLGLFITLAIAVHNIPEGLAISLVLVPRGGGRRPGGFLERLLQPAAAPYGGAGLRLRRSLWPPTALRARVCGRGDDVDGFC